MGNGASHRMGSTINIDGDRIEVARLKMLYPEMRDQLKKKDDVIFEKNKKISYYENEINNLKKEIHQLKSVLDVTNVKQTFSTIPENDKLDNYDRSDSRTKFISVVTKVRNKRFAVSAESSNETKVDLQKIPKSVDAKKLIKDSITNNKFLKHLEEGQVKEIVMCMYLRSFNKDEYIITEGEQGNAFCVVNKGFLEVSQGSKVLGKALGPGELFGELAILYNCTRTASVRALSDVEVWTIERQAFQAVMKKSGTMRRDEDCKFLQSTPIFKGFSLDSLFKIVDVAEEEFYQEDEYIVHEGERGDSFFIIKEGMFKIILSFL